MGECFRARWLWVEPGRCYAPGEVRVARGRVVSVGPARGRVPDRVILPGLVDAHVHLQLDRLPRERRQFVAWVRAVMRAGAEATHDARVARAGAAVRELLADGVTAFGEIDSTGASVAALRQVPVAGVCYQELTGFDLGRAGARAFVQQRCSPGTRYCRAGLSPHAPYSASPELFRTAHRRDVPLAVHVAETPEEVRFLRTGRGPFRELLEALGRLPARFRPPGVGPVEYLDRLRVLSPRTTLVHAQHITTAEASIVRRRGSPVVVCPGTIRYFHRTAPPVESWLRIGIDVALGTDSIASNTRLSMRNEMSLARRAWPGLPPETILAMATAHGGAALGRRGLGTLRRGAPASFLALPFAGDARACLEAFTSGELAPSGVWLRGVPV